MFLSVKYGIIMIILIMCIPEVGSVGVLPCSAGSCILGPVWNSRQERYLEVLEPRSIEVEMMMRNASNVRSQCSKLKREHDSMEIDWHWW